MKNIIKDIRKELLIIKDGFLDAKSDSRLRAFELANLLFILIIEVLIVSSCTIILGINYVSIAICIISFIVYIIFIFYPKAFRLIFPLSVSITLRLFGRYGRVISKKEWSKIKKYCPKLYKIALSKRSYSQCYYYSRALALYLTDAKLLYCSVVTNTSKKTGHCVIFKNNCVYDTNAKQHFSYDEYCKYSKLTVYKFFSFEEYSKKSFFDDVIDDFAKWCDQTNTYFSSK